MDEMNKAVEHMNAAIILAQEWRKVAIEAMAQRDEAFVVVDLYQAELARVRSRVVFSLN